MNPLTWLTGYRTYLMGLAAIATGLVLLSEGKYPEGIASLTAGLGLITGREAVRRIENQQ